MCCWGTGRYFLFLQDLEQDCFPFLHRIVEPIYLVIELCAYCVKSTSCEELGTIAR